MESNTTSLLPYVLDLLSRQPDLCSSIDAICEKIKDVVTDDVISPFGSLKRAVEFSVELGINLGLLTLSNKRRRHPPKILSKNHERAVQLIGKLKAHERRHLARHLAKTGKALRAGVRRAKGRHGRQNKKRR